jgi:hypothetical protein
VYERWYHRKVRTRKCLGHISGVVVNTCAGWSNIVGTVDVCVALVKSTIIGDTAVAVVGTRTVLFDNLVAIVIILQVETKGSRVDVAVAENEEGTEDWLCKDVENTVEDSLGVWRNNIASFAQAPGDGIDEPEEDGPDTANRVDLLNGSPMEFSV